MEIKNKENGNGPGDKSGDAEHSNNYNAEFNSGIISAEGGNDNGASTLRALRKKHANDSPDKKKS